MSCKLMQDAGCSMLVCSMDLWWFCTTRAKMVNVMFFQNHMSLHDDNRFDNWNGCGKNRDVKRIPKKSKNMKQKKSKTVAKSPAGIPALVWSQFRGSLSLQEPWCSAASAEPVQSCHSSELWCCQCCGCLSAASAIHAHSHHVPPTHAQSHIASVAHCLLHIVCCTFSVAHCLLHIFCCTCHALACICFEQTRAVPPAYMQSLLPMSCSSLHLISTQSSIVIWSMMVSEWVSEQWSTTCWGVHDHWQAVGMKKHGVALGWEQSV